VSLSGLQQTIDDPLLLCCCRCCCSWQHEKLARSIHDRSSDVYRFLQFYPSRFSSIRFICLLTNLSNSNSCREQARKRKVLTQPVIEYAISDTLGKQPSNTSKTTTTTTMKSTAAAVQNVLWSVLFFFVAAVMLGAAVTTANHQHNGIRTRHDNNDNSKNKFERNLQTGTIITPSPPCSCTCTRLNGELGVLINKSNRGNDVCVRYGAAERRIARGRATCVVTDCESRAAQANVEQAAEQAAAPECPCTCQRNPNKWGVLIVKTNGGEAQCARNGRAARAIEKGRASCQTTGCVPEVDVTSSTSTATAAKSSSTELPTCPCTCQRNPNKLGVLIEMTSTNASGQLQCARSGRAARTIAKGRAVCSTACR